MQDFALWLKPAETSTAVSAGLLLLRVLIGCSLLTHGLPKIRNFAAVAPNFPTAFGLSRSVSLVGAIIGEVILNILVIVGLFGQIAAALVALQFVVIFFVIHAGTPFAKRELGWLYLAAYLTLAVTGPGACSLDALLF